MSGQQSEGKDSLAWDGREKPSGQLRPGAGGLGQVPSPFWKSDPDQHKLQQDTPLPNNASNKRNSLSRLHKTPQALVDENKQVSQEKREKTGAERMNVKSNRGFPALPTRPHPSGSGESAWQVAS